MLDSGELKPDLTAIQACISRNASGLNIEIRASEKLEAFFRQLSGNAEEQVDMRTIGRFWTLKENGGAMNLYAMPADPELQGIIPLNGLNGVSGYRLDRPGTRILEPDRDGRGLVVNISFLRLVGISGINGMNIGVRGVYGEPAVHRIYDSIINASATFYESFLKPIKLSVTMREE